MLPWGPQERGEGGVLLWGSQEGGGVLPWSLQEGGDMLPWGPQEMEGGDMLPWGPQEGGDMLSLEMGEEGVLPWEIGVLP